MLRLVRPHVPSIWLVKCMNTARMHVFVSLSESKSRFFYPQWFINHQKQVKISQKCQLKIDDCPADLYRESGVLTGTLSRNTLVYSWLNKALLLSSSQCLGFLFTANQYCAFPSQVSGTLVFLLSLRSALITGTTIAAHYIYIHHHKNIFFFYSFTSVESARCIFFFCNSLMAQHWRTGATVVFSFSD